MSLVLSRTGKLCFFKCICKNEKGKKKKQPDLVQMLLFLVWHVIMFLEKEADVLVGICHQCCCKKKMLC